MSRPSRAVLGWAVLALVGVTLAAVAGYEASRVATEPIGLSSEPIRAGRELAPPSQRRRPARTATPEPWAAPTTSGGTVDDSVSGSDDHGAAGDGDANDD